MQPVLSCNYCLQFQNHDFVLGSLADFPAILFEEFFTDKHLIRLSVLCQAQFTEFLPKQRKEIRQIDKKGKKKKKKVNLSDKTWNKWHEGFFEVH